jgi:hypothetical protein
VEFIGLAGANVSLRSLLKINAHPLSDPSRQIDRSRRGEAFESAGNSIKPLVWALN